MIDLCLLSVLSATRAPITIICPSDIDYEVNLDVIIIPVNWRTPILLNVDDSVHISVECSATSGDDFGIGPVTVTCNAKSGNAVEDTCYFFVSVINIG